VQIDHDDLFALSDEDLREMGMRLAENRALLLQHVSALRFAWGHEVAAARALRRETLTPQRADALTRGDGRGFGRRFARGARVSRRS